VPTKDELLDEAEEAGIDVPEGATKADIQELLGDDDSRSAADDGEPEFPASVDDGVIMESVATAENNRREAEATKAHNENKEEEDA
jgi:hypothetical protein